MIRTLFIGDVCGKPGRDAICKILPDLKKKENIDLVITNIENIAHGRGATPDTVREVMNYGVDYMTGGNHIWRRPEFEDLLSGDYPVIRGLNYPDDLPGKGWAEIDLGSKGKVLLITLIGHAFMNERTITEPFRRISSFLDEHDLKQYAGVFIDFHAESTAEKVSFGMFLDGKVSAVVGTHTHIPTADEKILKGGTAYITDVGMTGPVNSVLWVKPEIIFQQSMFPYSPAYEIVEDGEVKLDAVLIDINSYKNALSIQRININK